jgi:hypothetical protein
MPRDARSFLEDALGEIARSEPEADRALRAALRGLTARLSDGARSFVLQAGGEGWCFCDGERTADIVVAFDEAVILDLIEGVLTLHEAILGERIIVFGPIDNICKFYDALFVFLEGLLRASGASALLERFRKA